MLNNAPFYTFIRKSNYPPLNPRRGAENPPPTGLWPPNWREDGCEPPLQQWFTPCSVAGHVRLLPFVIFYRKAQCGCYCVHKSDILAPLLLLLLHCKEDLWVWEYLFEMFVIKNEQKSMFCLFAECCIICFNVSRDLER